MALPRKCRLKIRICLNKFVSKEKKEMETINDIIGVLNKDFGKILNNDDIEVIKLIFDELEIDEVTRDNMTRRIDLGLLK